MHAVKSLTFLAVVFLNACSVDKSIRKECLWEYEIKISILSDYARGKEHYKADQAEETVFFFQNKTGIHSKLSIMERSLYYETIEDFYTDSIVWRNWYLEHKCKKK